MTALKEKENLSAFCAIKNYLLFRMFVGCFKLFSLVITLFVVKKINVLEVGEEFLYQCLINHCQNEYPSISPLARMLKMLHTILPSTSLDNLTSCIQKCADTLSLEGQSDTVRNFAADLIDQVGRLVLHSHYALELNLTSQVVKWAQFGCVETLSIKCGTVWFSLATMHSVSTSFHIVLCSRGIHCLMKFTHT